MTGQRALPANASVRFLKLEAKRRLAGGEFQTLHSAQLTVAREHGQPSWVALKNLIDGRSRPAGHALAQLGWVQGRFRDAAEADWTAPGDAELRDHFTAAFLQGVPPTRLVAMISEVATELRQEPHVVVNARSMAQIRLAGRMIIAVTEPSPPYRLAGMQVRRLGERISDARTASPSTSTEGSPPEPVAEIAANAIAGLGLPGLVLAGPAWAIATGWADLDRDEPLHPGYLFPGYTITGVITAVAVLRLVADGRLSLDAPANRYLATVRLADDEVTVRQLLSRAGGAVDPPTLFGPAVPDLTSVVGPVIACTGRRGLFDSSLAGYAALGEIVARLAEQPYPDAVSRLVLLPLGMTASWFPARWPTTATAGRPSVTGYDVTDDGVFESLPGEVCVFAAAGGLWTTAADLVRFGLGWPSLLPRALAAQALRPHVALPTGVHAGLGWIVNATAGVIGLASEGPSGTASLLVTLDGRRAYAALANRRLPIEPVNGAALRAASGGGSGG